MLNSNLNQYSNYKTLPMDKERGDQSNSATNFQNLEYKREMGAYRPQFEAIPEDYYPLSCCEVVKYSIVVLLAIGVGLGIMIGFIYWLLASTSFVYVQIWVIVFLGTLGVIVVLLYFEGKRRITLEKELIQESRKRQQNLRNKAHNIQPTEQNFEL